MDLFAEIPVRTLKAIHGILFLASLVAVNAVLAPLMWPWYLVLPVFVYAAIVLVSAALRRSAPTIALGSIGGWPLAYAVLVALGAAGILIGFEAIFQPDASELAARMPVGWFGNPILAGICFCVVNAAAEEVIFRGILWELIADEWGKIAALGITAALFGLGHLHGYPPGSVGAVMAGLYGIALGILRWWTGGLGLAIACHIGADATIFCILAATGALSTEC